jgi:hypothetical protein
MQLFPVLPIDPTKVKARPPEREGAIGALKTGVELRAEWHTELRRELESVRGLVFVDGDFQGSANGESTILIEEFAERPFKASFRIFLPRKAVLDVPPTKPLHLTVFGDVTKPFGEDGFVDIRPVALY